MGEHGGPLTRETSGSGEQGQGIAGTYGIRLVRRDAYIATIYIPTVYTCVKTRGMPRVLVDHCILRRLAGLVSGVADEARTRSFVAPAFAECASSRCGATLGPHASTVKPPEWRDEGVSDFSTSPGEVLLETISPLRPMGLSGGRSSRVGPARFERSISASEPPVRSLSGPSHHGALLGARRRARAASALRSSQRRSEAVYQGLVVNGFSISCPSPSNFPASRSSFSA